MKSAPAVFALLLSPLVLAAQTASHGLAGSFGVAGMENLSPSQTGAPASAPQITVLHIPPANLGCPVYLRAQHGASGSMVQTDRSRPKGLAQLLHLTLIDSHPDAKHIVSARLKVSGLSGVARVTQTRSSAGDADSVRTLEIKFTSETEKQVSGDLWVPAMTAVLSIDLESVTYADGSSRTFSGRDACHITPDPLMLVSGR